MPELTPQQMKILERLFAAGESALCVHRGDCAAVLTPVPNGGLRLLAPPTYLIDGNLGVKLRKGNREVFVWKKKEMDATPERLQELEVFRRELTSILEEAAPQ